METLAYPKKKVNPLPTTTPRSSIKITLHRTPNREQQKLLVDKLNEIIQER